MKIDHKCNKTVKYYPDRIYSKELCTQFKSDRNKQRGALSKLENNILSKERRPQMFHVFFAILRFFYNSVCVRCAYFCPTYIEGGVLSSIYGIDSICWFYYIFGQFLLVLWALLHFWSMIAFVASVGSCW